MTDQFDSRKEGLLVLIDPAFEASADEPDPPPESIVGGWAVAPDGSTGRFRPNPGHVPSSPEVPSDPVDAVLRLMVRGEAEGADLMAVLGQVDPGVALGAEATALVTLAPDGVPCVLATTAPRHRAAAAGVADPPVADWREVTFAEVAAALPEQGVDVLLNPGGPASMRVTAAAVREAVGRGGGSGSVSVGALQHRGRF